MLERITLEVRAECREVASANSRSVAQMSCPHNRVPAFNLGFELPASACFILLERFSFAGRKVRGSSGD